MILTSNFTLKIFFWFMIIFVFTEKSQGSPDGEKKFDIRLGFDLTQGANGMPAIKMRRFNDSEFHPRASAEETSEKTTKPSIRAADSSATEEETATEKNDALKFDSSKQSSEESNNETEDEDNRFTKAGEFEPEGNKEGEAYSESEGSRRKRSVKKNKNQRLRRNMKKIGNKFKNARKLGVSKVYW